MHSKCGSGRRATGGAQCAGDSRRKPRGDSHPVLRASERTVAQAKRSPATAPAQGCSSQAPLWCEMLRAKRRL